GFAMREMVQARAKLRKVKLGMDHVVTVIGPSMGGMQALQWGVSYPEFMDSLVALVPLARTPAWSVVIVDASRKAIMLDPAWKGGEYASPPLEGLRLFRDIVAFAGARARGVYRHRFGQP